MQPNSSPVPIIAGNWKMHKGPDAARAFARRLGELAPWGADRSLVLIPPAISLTALADELGEREGLYLGVQNIYWKEEGAFTGEISATMARDAGANVALVGHSERRHIFGETNDETRLKVAAALAAGITPILCVGETEAERDAGRVADVITAQLDDALKGLRPDEIGRCIVAYEPVWAIGTGRNATPQDAAAAHSILKDRLETLCGTRAGRGVPILYGGSVKPENAADLIGAENVDGLLVGGASLDPESFVAIANAAATAYGRAAQPAEGATP